MGSSTTRRPAARTPLPHPAYQERDNARTAKGDDLPKTPRAGLKAQRAPPAHTAQSTECRASLPLATMKTMSRAHRRMTTRMKTPMGTHPQTVSRQCSGPTSWNPERQVRNPRVRWRGWQRWCAADNVVSAPPGGARGCGDWGG